MVVTGGSWVALKNKAREAYENRHYEEAVRWYEEALQPERECPTNERKLLYSNLVACRLHVNQVDRALLDAKKCLEIDPNWSKGHVRLASVYSAMGRSNDACNSLQTAIRLDPNNRTAKQMLVQELRRDHSNHSQTSTNAFADDMDEPDVTANTPSVPDQIRDYLKGAQGWYFRQSDDMKTFLKILLGLFVLYICFGGRFGFESRPQRHGHYGRNNPYEQYRNRDRDYNRDYYNDRYSSTSIGGDGFMLQIVLLLLVAYVCHQNGINPLHGVFMMNAMQGRRRHFGGFGGFGMGGPFMGGFHVGGFGRGMGGFGRRRPGPRW